MKLTVLAILMAAAAIGAALLLFSEGGIGLPRQVSDQREAMGTTVAITVYDKSVRVAEAAIDEAFARIAEIESIASPYDAASELGNLNLECYLPAASDELVEMLRLSFVVNQISDGAFDVTIGALLDVWQFDPTAGTQFWDLSPEVQSASITAARRHVGMARILLGSGRKTSISLVPGTRIDLGGIVKGYAVDGAVAVLRDAGIEHARVDAGGDLRVYGGTPNGSPWEIALRNPEDPSEYVASLHLMDGAVATSGSYQRFFDPSAELERILDPRTGYPATAASSATVVAPTCAEADALATTVFVLGPESGIALVERLGSTEALVVGFEDPTTIHRSSGIATFETPSED